MPIGWICNRYREGWQKITFYVRANLIFFWLIFSSGIAMKIASVDPWHLAAAGVLIIMMIILPLSLETAMLLEYRGAEMFDYGGSEADHLRDQWLGKGFLRVLLTLGNIGLCFIFFGPK